MKCKNIKCNKEHDGTFGSGKFCSRGCANSRIKTAETKRKISNSVKSAMQEGRLKTPLLDPIVIENMIEKRKKTWETKLLAEDFSSLKFGRIRKRVFLEQEHKCNRCKLDRWLNQPLVLELEHKDGDNQNNERGNLEGLCPNCHSLTLTWRGRNKKKVTKEPITAEQIVKTYIETGNIRQCLLKLGLAAKGNNYNRVKTTLNEWGIEY